MDDDVVIALAAYCVLRKMKAKKIARKVKRRDVRARVNRYLGEGNVEGDFENFENMLANRAICYENFHMDMKTFEELYCLLEPHLQARRNCRADFICSKQKLAAVLEYLASGSLASQVARLYTISKQHMGAIIDYVCDAICIELKPFMPNGSQEEFLEISKGFMDRWQFPHCVGSLDAKRILVKTPPKNCSGYGAPAMVALAVADWKYKFTHLDIGEYGVGDAAHIFAASNLGRAVLDERIEFPENDFLGAEKLPYCFVAADEFQLCKRVLKGYSCRKKGATQEETVFNCRLNRARRCVDNAFGILCCNWLCLKRTLICSPEKAQKIVAACFLLHNFLMEKSQSYCPPGFADAVDAAGNLVVGEWRDTSEYLNNSSFMGSSLESFRGRQFDIAKNFREKFKTFVNSPIGAVPWQEEAAMYEC